LPKVFVHYSPDQLYGYENQYQGVYNPNPASTLVILVKFLRKFNYNFRCSFSFKANTNPCNHQRLEGKLKLNSQPKIRLCMHVWM